MQLWLSIVLLVVTVILVCVTVFSKNRRNKEDNIARDETLKTNSEQDGAVRDL